VWPARSEAVAAQRGEDVGSSCLSNRRRSPIESGKDTGSGCVGEESLDRPPAWSEKRRGAEREDPDGTTIRLRPENGRECGARDQHRVGLCVTGELPRVGFVLFVGPSCVAAEMWWTSSR
jgi:hypothetical protein